MFNKNLQEFAQQMTPHYLTAAAWATSGTDTTGQEVESLESFEFSEEAKEEAGVHCLYFCSIAWPWLNDNGETLDPAQVGHDLFLSRNGHGAGFFDRAIQYADTLQLMAHELGTHDPYIGDDGLIYF